MRDRNQAEALAGTDLYVERKALPAPAEGEFYLADLVGKPVTAAGTVLGIVAGVQNYGAGDLLELESGELIPVAFVTVNDGTVTADLPEGFLDPADDSQRGQNGRP